MTKRPLIFAAACLALASCAVSAPPPMDTGSLPSTSCDRPANTAALGPQVLQATTQFRRSQGLGPLTWNARLAVAAQAHACELAARGVDLTHAGADGSNSFQRAQRAGFPARLVAENLAWGRFTAQQVVDGWAGSPEHRKNMMHPRIEKMGLGVANGPKGPIWVQVMAR